MKKNALIISFIALFLIILSCLSYWFFFMRGPAGATPGTGTQNNPSGFQPFNRTPQPNSNNGQNTTGTNTTGSNGNNWMAGAPFKLPILRMLSGTPVGGYGASTTATTTIVRWIDRGRGNVYEAAYDSPMIDLLSNTIVPRMYDSLWNRNLTSFIGSLLQETDSAPTTVYAQLIKQATSSQDQASTSLLSVAPYALHGKNIPGTLVGFAESPDKSKLFLFMNENGLGAGYISNFDGTGTSKLFTTPLTQVNVDWPTDNALTITTKGSAYYDGFMYSVNTKTGAWAKVLGPVTGLSAIMSTLR